MGISGEFPGQLPGSTLINNMYVWLQLLKENYPEYLHNIRISRVRYVKHQIHHWIAQYRHGTIDFLCLLKRFKLLPIKDWIGLVSILWDKRSLNALYFMLKKRSPSKVDTFYYGPKSLNGVFTSSDLYHKVIKNR